MYFKIKCNLYIETQFYFLFRFHQFQTINAGDLSERFKLKEKLQCKNFTWFITNVWQELSIFDRNVFAWGSVSIKQVSAKKSIGKINKSTIKYKTEDVV